MNRSRPALFCLVFLLGAQAGYADPIHIVALGASQTAGKIVAREEAYPAQLEKLLRSQGVEVQIANQGESGDTSSDLRRRLESAVPPGTRIVLFQPGTNDCGRRGNSERIFEENLRAILGRMREQRLSVLVLGGGCYEHLQAGLPAEYGFTYYGRMTQGLERYSRPDGQHYAADGYTRMAELMAPRVKALIEALK